MTAVVGEEEMGGPGYEPAIRYNFICFVFEVSVFQKFLLLKKKKFENHFIKSFVYLIPLINLGLLSLYFTM